jgi:hypothetical protein
VRESRCTAIVGTATLLWLITFPASSQSLGSGQYCQNTSRGLVCNTLAGPSGPRVYERWENGAAATRSATGYRPPANNASQLPQSFGAYGNIRGFGQ